MGGFARVVDVGSYAANFTLVYYKKHFSSNFVIHFVIQNHEEAKRRRQHLPHGFFVF